MLPFTLDVNSIISEYSNKTKADGSNYKETAVLHVIKYKVIAHAQRVWRIKNIDENIAEELIKIYQMQIKTWCKIKQIDYTNWHSLRTREWMNSEFKRIYKWELPVKV
jgi:phosphoketolase